VNEKNPDLSNVPLGFDIIKGFWQLYFNAIGISFVGAQHIPKGGAAIIASNHITAIDPFGVGLVTPRRVHFMSKVESFSHPVLRQYMIYGNAFPVDRGKMDLQAIKTALRILQGGQILVIFPQGTRGGQEVKGGTSLIALKAKVPVIPAGIHLEPNWFGGKRYVIHYGEPIRPEGKTEEHTERLNAAMLALAQD
jgi:1-acyl-sn-glycerol-3-phosphate acyltransferase